MPGVSCAESPAYSITPGNAPKSAGPTFSAWPTPSGTSEYGTSSLRCQIGESIDCRQPPTFAEIDRRNASPNTAVTTIPPSHSPEILQCTIMNPAYPLELYRLHPVVSGLANRPLTTGEQPGQKTPTTRPGNLPESTGAFLPPFAPGRAFGYDDPVQIDCQAAGSGSSHKRVPLALYSACCRYRLLGVESVAKHADSWLATRDEEDAMEG